MGCICLKTRPGFGLREEVNPLMHIRDTTLSIKSNAWRLLFFFFHHILREEEEGRAGGKERERMKKEREKLAHRQEGGKTPARSIYLSVPVL